MVTKPTVSGGVKQPKAAKNLPIQAIDNNIKQNNPTYAKIANINNLPHPKITKEIDHPNKIHKRKPINPHPRRLLR